MLNLDDTKPNTVHFLSEEATKKKVPKRNKTQREQSDRIRELNKVFSNPEIRIENKEILNQKDIQPISTELVRVLSEIQQFQKYQIFFQQYGEKALDWCYKAKEREILGLPNAESTGPGFQVFGAIVTKAFEFRELNRLLRRFEIYEGTKEGKKKLASFFYVCEIYQQTVKGNKTKAERFGKYISDEMEQNTISAEYVKFSNCEILLRELQDNSFQEEKFLIPIDEKHLNQALAAHIDARRLLINTLEMIFNWAQKEKDKIFQEIEISIKNKKARAFLFKGFDRLLGTQSQFLATTFESLKDDFSFILRKERLPIPFKQLTEFLELISTLKSLFEEREVQKESFSPKPSRSVLRRTSPKEILFVDPSKTPKDNKLI